MAIVTTGFRPYDSYLGFAEETTFGTAVNTISKFDVIGQNIPHISLDYFIDESMKNRERNFPDIGDHFSTRKGRFQSYAIPECLGHADDLAHMLYAACQNVNEAIASPFLKTYTFDGSADPDFSSNGGYFFTLGLKNPTANTGQRLISCVLQDLTIRFSSDNGGRCTFSGTAISGKEPSNTFEPGGTPNFSSVVIPTFYDNDARTLTVNGLDLVWYEFEVRIENQFAYIGYTASGNAENYKLVTQKLSARAVVKHDTNSDALMDLKAGSVAATVFTIGVNTTAGYFKLNCDDTILRDWTADRGSDGEVQKLTLELDCRRDTANSQNPTIEIADGVDHAW